MRIKKLLLILTVAFLTIILCFVSVQGDSLSKPDKKPITSPVPEWQNVLIYNFAIHSIKPDQDFYRLSKPADLKPANSAFDKEGIPMYQKGKGKPMYNHPVRLAHHSINFLESYHMTKDYRYVKEAEKYAQRLVDIAVEQNGAMYFPYEFEVYLHNLPTEYLKPGWYSGMAQGQALSAFVRLYQETDDPKYLEWADKVFQSFRQPKSDGVPIWVSMVDDGYYWIEEYPMEKPTKVLNGFIFAIYGLYDYYQLTGKEEAKVLLLASLTTIYDHIEKYRNKDDASFYGLKLDHRSVHYHLVHIEQLKALHDITGEQYFLDMSEQFHHDWYGLPAKVKRQVGKVKDIFDKGDTISLVSTWVWETASS